MKRLLISFIVLGLFSAHAAGQEPNQSSPKCKLTVDKAPNIRGVRLGMTQSQLFEIFPDAPNDPQNKPRLEHAAERPNFGFASIGLNPSDEQKSLGVESFLISLFDQRVVAFWVSYRGGNSEPPGPRWPRVEELVDKFSPVYRLPSSAEWEAENSTSNRRVLRCAGFEVTVDGGDRATIRLTDRSNWSELIKKRREADEDRLRREFKP